MNKITKSLGLGSIIGLGIGAVGSVGYVHLENSSEHCTTPDTFISALTDAERNWRQVGTITGIPMQLNTPIPEEEFNQRLNSMTCRVDSSRPAIAQVLRDMHDVLAAQHHRITLFLSRTPAAEATLRPRLRALEQQIAIIDRCVRQPAPQPNNAPAYCDNNDCTEIRTRCRTLLARCNNTDALLRQCREQVSTCRSMRARITATIAAVQNESTPRADYIRAEARRIESTLPNCNTMAGECDQTGQSTQGDCNQIRQTCETALQSCPERDE